MKRYSLEESCCNGCYPLSESDDGEWVRFEDVEKELKLHDATGADKACMVMGKENQCNCEENWCTEPERDWSDGAFIRYEWICPAHGYKRL